MAIAATERAVRLLRRDDVLECVRPKEVLEVVREAIVAHATGNALAPAPLSFEFSEQRGEAHVKGAYIAGSEDWTVKLATGFYDNPSRGLPTASGLSLVSSAETGLVEAIILDGGHLTDVRTAAAGSLAADVLAADDLAEVAILGCGIQARVQLEYLLHVRRPRRIVVYGRRRDQAEAYAREMVARHGVAVEVVSSAREAVADAQLVITATPAQGPLIEDTCLRQPVVIVAVGSDMPGKQELDPAILDRAELVAADDPGQSSRVGELQHAPAALERARFLGEVLEAPPAKPPDGIRVADLTGLGAEDAAVAGLVARRAHERGLGEPIRLA